MSLYDIFMQRAELEHQNALASDNTGMALQSLAEGVANGINEQQKVIEEQNKKEYQLKKDIELVNRINKSNGDLIASIKDNKISLSNKSYNIIPNEKDFEIAGYNTELKPYWRKKDTSMIDENPDVAIQSMQVAKEIAGVRGAQKLAPKVAELLKQGKTKDQIQDSLRFSNQSEALSGDFRNAIQNASIGMSKQNSEMAFDYLDDSLSKGNIDAAKDTLKRVALQGAGVDATNAVVGKERTIDFVTEISDDLRKLELSGINTNIFSGTEEQVAQKIGLVKSAELRQVATKIELAIINYRRSITGAAFNQLESKEYRNVFPNISSVSELNSARIDALKKSFQGDIDTFYGSRMGRLNYNRIFKTPYIEVKDANNVTDFENFDKNQSQDITTAIDRKNQLYKKYNLNF